MSTIVVLGANSFSGQDFVDLLLDDPALTVIGVSRSPERSALFLRYKLRENLLRYRYVQLDMNRQMPALLDLLDAERPEAVVNFAAQSEVAPSWEHPEHWYQTNCVALASLVNHLRQRTYLRRYVHISSPEVYGTCVGEVREDAPLRPSTPYAASKAAADLLLLAYVKEFGFPATFVRATNVYGARQQLFKIIPRSVIFVRLGKRIELHGGGAAVKSYIHVRDVSRGELAILREGRAGEIYHLAPSQGVSVREVVRAICDRLGRRLEDCIVTMGERPGQDAAYVIDSTRARTELGWKPQVALDEGLSDVVAWVGDYWDEIVRQPLTYAHKA
ncbi:MAG TPA: dTDP-glucose 4,6-dehydratase [Candidatus Rokubacteria bacterium]|nr:dTDP-glucose 4,6-dehydratase [Candidatus Rokubacteria bacterium]